MEAFKKAHLHPDKVAIFLEDEPDATYGSIAEEALKLIAALDALGLQQGDVIYMGTPAGVGAVQRGDVLTGGIDGIADFTVKIA